MLAPLVPIREARIRKLQDINLELVGIQAEIDYWENWSAFDPSPELADLYERRNWLEQRQSELSRLV